MVWSGLVATTLAAAVFWLFRTFAATRFTPATALGGLVFKESNAPLAETVGQAAFFVLHVTVVAAVYAALLREFGGPTLLRGALIGGTNGLLIVTVLPVLGTISASVRSGLEEPPGRFGFGWGRATPISILVGYVVYGALFAASLEGFSRVYAV